MTSGMRGTAVAVLFLALTGCRFFAAKVKPDPVPAPPPPNPVELKVPAPQVEPPGPPPKIETKTPEAPATVASLPTPPAPKPKKRTPKKTVPATAAASSTMPAAPATAPARDTPGATGAEASGQPPAAVPKLGEIFSDDQKLQLQRSCDESLSRAKEALGQLRGLTLSPDQKQSFLRVKVFMSQADQLRSKDPQTAKQLAERADLLSRDLVRTLR